MSNSISYEKRPDLHSVQMNNGLTSVFISVIAIAASILAKNDLQRKIAVWFASHDQGVFGLGLVGFDVSELPWVQEDFDEQKRFILQVIDSTTCQMGWEIAFIYGFLFATKVSSFQYFQYLLTYFFQINQPKL
jgi:hypothetical protein